MKSLVNLLLCFVAVASATSCYYASDCGVDGRCWSCKSRQCVVNTRAIGIPCNDKNILTVYDKCQSDGSCIGRPIMCTTCSSDAACAGATKDALYNALGTVMDWPKPELGCTNITCKQFTSPLPIKCCALGIAEGQVCGTSKKCSCDGKCLTTP